MSAATFSRYEPALALSIAGSLMSEAKICMGAPIPASAADSSRQIAME
jgi:hypothetical protein